MNQEAQDQGMFAAWFDQQKNRTLLWRLLIGLCVLSVVAELFISRHGHFGKLDGFPGFYALVGLVGCALLAVFAKGAAYLINAAEDYYDDDKPA